jgi:hypothetical protein
MNRVVRGGRFGSLPRLLRIRWLRREIRVGRHHESFRKTKASNAHNPLYGGVLERLFSSVIDERRSIPIFALTHNAQEVKTVAAMCCPPKA